MHVHLRIKFMGHRLYWLAWQILPNSFPKWLSYFTLPAAVVDCFHWLYSVLAIVSLLKFHDFDGCLMMFLCRFAFHFTDCYMRLSTFSYIYLLMDILLCETPKTFFFHFSFGFFCVSDWFIGVLYAVWYIALYRLYILHIFSHSFSCFYSP